ncbi:MAG: metal ABC transporter solute-binding protein, Zn/Mn family [Oceanobacter sp.]
MKAPFGRSILPVLLLALLPAMANAGLFDRFLSNKDDTQEEPEQQKHSHDSHSHGSHNHGSHDHSYASGEVRQLDAERPLPVLDEALTLPEPSSLQGSAFGKQAPSVLATIHPLGMVAASIVPMENLSVLIPAGMTPHDFSLKPSDIDRILNADIILWSGPASEPYMEGLAARWPDKHWISTAPEELEYPIQNPHWWLSPELMKRVQTKLAGLLKVDTTPFNEQIDQVMALSREQLAPVSDRGFLVFHNAYEHWVDAVGIKQLGVFTETPEHKPGLRGLNEKRAMIESGDVACVFVEPEFSSDMVDKMLGDHPIPKGSLDAQGLNIPLSANAYALFMLDLAARASDCLTAVTDDGINEAIESADSEVMLEH